MLLPSDYSKDYRKFRPSDENNMRQRLSRIRRWRRRKTALHSCKKKSSRRMIECQAATPSSDAAISALSQNMPTINPVFLRTSAQETEDFMKCNVGLLSSEAYTTSPKRDINGINGECTEEYNMENGIESINSESHALQLSFLGPEHIAHPPVPQRLSEIGRRLGGLRSGSYMKCIDSILRYSSTDSCRSSFSSLMSRLSSRKSRQSIDRDNAPVMEAAEKEMHIHTEETTYSTSEPLSREEQLIWDELVNENQLAQQVSPPLNSRSALLSHRPCCHLKFDHSHLLHDSTPLCQHCQFSTEHLVVVLYPWESSLAFGRTFGNINKKDTFGNTPLHFLANSTSVSFQTIYNLVEKGAEHNSRNAAGETFMHILNVDDYLSNHGFLDYLRAVIYLLNKGFQFDGHDYHGNTVRYNFIEGSRGRVSDHRRETILSLMKPARGLDDFAIDVRDHRTYPLFLDPRSSNKIVLGLEEEIQAGKGCSFRTVLQNITWSVREGKSDVVLIAQYFPKVAAFIDSGGDSFLISVVKLFPDDVSEMDLKFHVMEVLKLGAEIEMRDRAGDSMLTIACCRGFRPLVKSLVSRGANVHARNNREQGILSQCWQCLDHAREVPDDKLYARILSCMNVVIDAGGKSQPTEIDEWTLPQVVGYDESMRRVFKEHGYA